MKQLFFLLSCSLMLISCSMFSKLTSTTAIEPKNRFDLGKNKHGKFKVILKNLSTVEIEVYQMTEGAGKQASQMLKPDQRVTVKVGPNTALYIENPSDESVSVSLKVSGDVGLSMGYKN